MVCCLFLKLTHNLITETSFLSGPGAQGSHMQWKLVDFRPDDGAEGAALVIDVCECLMSILNTFYLYSSIVMLHVCSQLHVMQLQM